MSYSSRFSFAIYRKRLALPFSTKRIPCFFPIVKGKTALPDKKAFSIEFTLI